MLEDKAGRGASPTRCGMREDSSDLVSGVKEIVSWSLVRGIQMMRREMI
jgi:hypothetical protein